MTLHEIKSKTYIDFDIIKNSNPLVLIEELKYLIGLNQIIIIWSKNISVEDMLTYCIVNNLTDYIWDYKLKDSVHYTSVDLLIDNDEKLVERFKRNGIKANYIEKVV